MDVLPVILDARPDYMQSGSSEHSLLLTPLGAEIVLERVLRALRAAHLPGLTILPAFEPDEVYASAIRAIAPGAPIRSVREFDDFLYEHEPSDQMLVVDPRHFPLGEHPLRALLGDQTQFRLVQHLVQLDQSSHGTTERVVFDERKQVCRIQRLYDGVTQLQASGVACSLASFAAMRDVRIGAEFCLKWLRTDLASRGIPSRDVPSTANMCDLSNPSGLLELSEWFTVRETRRGRSAAAEVGPISVGDGSRVDPRCRIRGPVVVYAGARVDAGAVLIGPTVLGPGSRVESGATVSHSLLLSGARVRAGAAVANDVVCGVAEDDAASANGRPARGRIDAGPEARFRYEPATETAAAPRRTVYPAVKRAIDCVLSLVGLIVLSPLMLATAVLIRTTSRGPIFFGHEREGLRGRVFRCWKFRTMVEGAHAQQRALYRQNTLDGPQFKLDEDPRVTRVGRWLRAANVDELPQLFNVLRGDMSLIGPRPSPFRENQICVPWREARLSVRPGITGLWQTCRHERAAGDFHQWIYFDTLYVRHLSFFVDLKILIATLVTCAGRWSVPLTWIIPRRTLRRDAAPLSELLPRSACLTEQAREVDETEQVAGAGEGSAAAGDSAEEAAAAAKRLSPYADILDTPLR